MIPVNFAGANALLGADQPEYEPLAVFRDRTTPEVRVTSCWRLSDEELAEIVRSRTIWIQLLTFGQSMQPIAMSILKPDGLP